MKARRISYLLLILSCLLIGTDLTHAQGTAFTYQGQLMATGSPANGYYDLHFNLYATNSGGTPLGTASATGTQVANGLFTVTLDFGNVFNGSTYWLEIQVRTNGSGNGFTTLVPRQNVTATPYAQYSLASGSVSGVLSTTNLPPNVALLNGSANFTGTVTAGNFSGNGAGLTNLSFVNIGQPNSTGQGLLSSTGFVALNAPQRAQLTATPFKTPPMGWMSWNCCGTDGARESNCLNMAHNMVTDGLLPLGYNLIQIDAGWYGYRDANGFIHESATRFPDGMSNMVATLHSMGFKVGIWHPLILTSSDVDYGADNESAVINTNFSNEQLLINDAQTFVNWGIDYVKLESFIGLLSGDEEQRWYELFAATAQNAGKPLYIMAAVGDIGPVGSDCFPWMYGVINARRSGGYDMGVYNGSGVNFNSYLGNFWFAAAHPEYSGPGCFISLDAIPAYDPAGPTYMLMTAMLNGELIWNGFNPYGAHATDAAYLTNVIQIDEDPAALMARCVLTNGTVTVWQKPLGSPGSSTFALAFFNTATTGTPVSTTVSFQSLGAVSPELSCLDLISNVTTVASNSLAVTVPPMTAYGFKLSPYLAPGVAASSPAANTIVSTGNVAVAGNLTAGSLAGNGAALTNLSATNISGSVSLANGGLGVGFTNQASGLTFQNGSGAFYGYPVVPLALLSGTSYAFNFTNDMDYGIFDSSFSISYPATLVMGLNAFTVPTSGTYYYVGYGQTAGTAADFQLYVSNSVSIPASVSVLDLTVAGTFTGTIPGSSISPQVPLAIAQGQPTPTHLGDGSYIYTTNTTENGSTLYLLRNATNGYADINFWTNNSLIFAIGMAANASSFPYQQPYMETYNNNFDFNFVGDGHIFGGYDHADQSFRWFNGKATSLGGYSDANLSVKLLTNGIATYGTTNGNSSSGSITITGSGFTNALLMTIQGYFNITNSSRWTNFNNAGTAWSTNTGAATNVHFILQPRAKITAPANAIDVSSVHWTAL